MEQKFENTCQNVGCTSGNDRTGCVCCLVKMNELLSQVNDALRQLGTVSPTARYTGQTDSGASPAREAVNEPIAVSQSVDEAKDKLLYNQLNSNSYANWLEVASCTAATRDHLEKAARLCAKIDNSDHYREAIASAIAKNDATDDKALLPLCDSSHYKVWLIAAQSVHAGKCTLSKLASQCAKIDNSDRFATDIADAISQNAAAEDEALLPLCDSIHYAVWLIAAGSTHAGTKTLSTLARKCGDIENNESFAGKIAEAIAKNCNIDDESLAPLCYTSYYSLWQIIANSPQAGKMTLSWLARRCSNTENDSSCVCAAAQSIANHPNCNMDILTLLASANSQKISHIAHEKMHEFLEQ